MVVEVHARDSDFYAVGDTGVIVRTHKDDVCIVGFDPSPTVKSFGKSGEQANWYVREGYLRVIDSQLELPLEVSGEI